MNSTSETASPKQQVHFFLSKKRSPSNRIFSITKSKKLKFLDKIDDTEETGTESCFSPTSKSSTVSIDELVIPSFFNDLILDSDTKEKLQKYEKITKDFADLEDREIYLVRRESLFSEQTCVSLNDSFC